MLKRLLLIGMICTPLSAFADIYFYVTHERDSKAHTDKRYVRFEADMINGVHNALLRAIPEGQTDYDSVHSALFAPNPEGSYNVMITCKSNQVRTRHYRSRSSDEPQESSIVRVIKVHDGDAVYATVSCQLDTAGHFEVPQVTWGLPDAGPVYPK